MAKIEFKFIDKEGNIQVRYIDKDEWEAFQRFRSDKRGLKDILKDYPLTSDECIEPKSESNE